MGMTEVQLDELAQIAVNIRNIKAKLDRNFVDITVFMMGLNNDYSTENTEVVMKKYKDLSVKYKEFLDQIDKYSEHLESIKGILERVEKKLAEQAAEITVNTIANSIDGAIGIISGGTGSSGRGSSSAGGRSEADNNVNDWL